MSKHAASYLIYMQILLAAGGFLLHSEEVITYDPAWILHILFWFSKWKVISRAYLLKPNRAQLALWKVELLTVPPQSLTESKLKSWGLNTHAKYSYSFVVPWNKMKHWVWVKETIILFRSSTYIFQALPHFSICKSNIRLINAYNRKDLGNNGWSREVGKTFMLEGLEVSWFGLFCICKKNEKFQRCLGR